MEDTPLSSASRLKEEGNLAFKAQDYPHALELYHQAGELLTEEGEGVKELKAICFGNVSACLQCMEEYAQAIEYCDKALALNPAYSKIRARKVRLLIDIGNIREAKDESDKGELPPDLKHEVDYKAAIHFEKEKDEMLGKLKDLGNTVLGKFGLSVDNFKTQKNENGSYNISFSQ